MLGGSAKAWLVALTGMAAMLGWTEMDRRITDDGKEGHPIAKWIDGLRADRDVWIERSDKHTKLARQSSDDFILFSSVKRPHMYRFTDTLAFERASPFGVQVSSHVDLSDLRVRRDITV
ncbi:hypothetical protein BDF22DRAFT_653093 [Syncephalis plumigaleata]|nr:hypothetical protein BDF22DRAFT_653093 [Syncephalis plumigaleata]